MFVCLKVIGENGANGDEVEEKHKTNRDILALFLPRLALALRQTCVLAMMQSRVTHKKYEM